MKNKTETFIGIGKVPDNYLKTILVDVDTGYPIYLEKTEELEEIRKMARKGAKIIKSALS